MGKGLNNTPELGHAHTYVNANHLLVLCVGRTECEAHRTDYDCDRKLTRDELYTNPRCPFDSLPDMNGVFPLCMHRKEVNGRRMMTLLTCEGDIGQQFGEAKTGMVIFKEVPLASRYLSENGLHKCLPFTDSLC